MLVKEPSFIPPLLLHGDPECSGPEMPESGPIREKKLEMENLFWWNLHRLGINPRILEIEGDRVHISDGTVDIRVPVEKLAFGLSLCLSEEGKRYPPIPPGRPFVSQIGYLSRRGRRGGIRLKEVLDMIDRGKEGNK
ncbi:hypothetical protein [Leptospirillum ferrooxidans]|uniref:Uncharacterized protein n=1 Tax=Leptospirillum ferrooxidans (strain C2-3) TaxID=1162668 RepID=I0ILW7_LEPFC|nr:hypothetical protein [Leptospirillum ferrooxidans]BAM06266.1 hypothetical protein LFE_0550 [Leptospirillum ferrooxidans C2-3]